MRSDETDVNLDNPNVPEVKFVDKHAPGEPMDPSLRRFLKISAGAALTAAAGGVIFSSGGPHEPFNLENEERQGWMDKSMEFDSWRNTSSERKLRKQQQPFYDELRAILDDTQARDQPERIKEFFKGQRKELRNQDFMYDIVAKAEAYTLSRHLETNEHKREELLCALIDYMPLDPSSVKFITRDDFKNGKKDFVIKNLPQLANDGWVRDDKTEKDPARTLIAPRPSSKSTLPERLHARITERCEKMAERQKMTASKAEGREL